ncbi:hypothetical protein C9F11_08875 [Streptomyces sp. YIM 121038]|uniref:hypothetical protein n=1 Tax=Streptomyces sp. YIM 121038 TaxID=2136401 RepID=UPI0011103566|nr:hypothetical protein [Streptomyces sp. YIM 121038]QCX75464.1 hypothetical protein C9F11_08875 [Streptomyces sp. YIM 121038]
MRARKAASAARKEAEWTRRTQEASTPRERAAVAFDRCRTGLLQAGREDLLEELASTIDAFRQRHAQ